MIGIVWPVKDLIGKRDIARALNKSMTTVERHIGQDHFPRPLTWIDGRPVYSKEAVALWYDRYYSR